MEMHKERERRKRSLLVANGGDIGVSATIRIEEGARWKGIGVIH